MKAYLLVGEGKSLEDEIEKLSKNLKAKVFEYPLKVIEDVRNLASLTKLALNERTLIVARGIEEAGEEALNAFLKALEEPQENLYYALTARNLHTLLPTVVSRCRVVKVKGKSQKTTLGEAENFLKGDIDQRLLLTYWVREREEALELTEAIVRCLHQNLLTAKDLRSTLKRIRLAQTTLERIKANANITLQLANLAINWP